MYFKRGDRERETSILKKMTVKQRERERERREIEREIERLVF